MFEAIAFYTFSILTVAMFTITVTTKQSLYAITALAAGMIFISAFFFLLGADFLGVIQIIVYTGAVMVLYAFGMMFFDTTRALRERNPSSTIVFGLSGMAALLVVILVVAPLVGNNIHALGEGINTYYPLHENVGNSQEVGYILFTKYLVPFELAAIMLLVAMIAGIVLAGKKMDQSLTLMKDEEIIDDAVTVGEVK